MIDGSYQAYSVWMCSMAWSGGSLTTSGIISRLGTSARSGRPVGCVHGVDDPELFQATADYPLHSLSRVGIDQRLASRPVVADGGYYGVPEVIIPFRKPVHGEITDWQEELNVVHRRVRARMEHAIGQIKTWKVLRDYRRAAHTLADAASGIAYLRNLAFIG